MGNRLQKLKSHKLKEEYLRIDPYEGLHYSRSPSLISKFTSFFSGVTADVGKRNFREVEYHNGLALHVSNPKAIDDIPNSIAAKTKMLSVHSNVGNFEFDMRNFGRFTQLQDITLGAFVFPENIASLSAIGEIRRLVIDVKVKEKVPFSLMKSIEELAVDGRSDLSEIESIAGTLKTLTVYNLRQVEILSTLKLLEYIKIVGSSSDENLNFLNGLDQLKVLILKNANSLKSVTGIESCSKLSHLTFENCKNLDDLGGLKGLELLNYLELRKCFKLDKINALKNAPSLNQLYVFDCPKIPRDAVIHFANQENLDRYFYK